MGKNQAVDYKRLLSKSGSLHRVMKAPGPWASIYIDRVKRFGDLHGAIVFPEQLLGIDQARVWSVKASFNDLPDFSLNVSVAAIHGGVRLRGEGREFQTIDDVLAFEKVSETPDQLTMGSPTAFHRTPFVASILFTNRPSAVAYATRYTKDALKDL